MERLHWAAHPIDAFHGIYRRWKPKSSVNEAELQASIDSLEDTGIIDDPVKEPDKKPRPLHRWILIGLFMFVVIALGNVPIL